MMREGDRPRPVAIGTVDLRRAAVVLVLMLRMGLVVDDDLLDAGGTSRMLSLRPVVGSVVCSRAGSWDTWCPSMTYWRRGLMLASLPTMQYLESLEDSRSTSIVDPA